MQDFAFSFPTSTEWQFLQPLPEAPIAKAGLADGGIQKSSSEDEVPRPLEPKVLPETHSCT